MTWYIVIAVGIAIALPLIAHAIDRYPRLYCALHGHNPRCSVEECGVMKFTCETCGKECRPQ
jgi:hypothetical protein